MTMPLNGDDKRWQAVLKRDASQDGEFVFAVRTTGIYCRPSCSSRPAKRENVAFFAEPQDAENAGFRACKRCRPDQPTKIPHAQAVRCACQAIETSEDEPSLLQLAHVAGLSPTHFQRVFKAHVGLSPKQYAKAVRKQRLLKALPESDGVTQAIYDAGYTASSRAYADGNGLGMTPGAYRKGAQGETVRYAFAQSSLGEILVASTAQGLCMVEFGRRIELLDKLSMRFRHANIVPVNAALADVVARVVALIDTPGASSALSLDVRGTVFQERVWQALGRISCGDTVSYSQLAAMIGQPKAARAVARACATNALAVVVPCHRVVGKSGELSGYRWGVERKRALLEREAKSKVGTVSDA
jgi:AraC family transcriptional regulator of adaptative response/methylated-DNA-[protein]-cysteine methyltransferase